MENKIKVLFLLSNPKDTFLLRLDQEMRQINELIERGPARDSFQLIHHLAVRPSDLQRVLLKHQPDIVHFCGHATDAEEIMMEDDTGRSQPVSKAALTGLFRLLKDNIKVVLLNACYSQPQAEAIGASIDFTIGMKKAIGDRLSITFASSFYQGLAFGRSVETSFELSKNELELEGITGADIPTLFVRPGADATLPFAKVAK